MQTDTSDMKERRESKTAFRIGIAKGCDRHAQRASIMSLMIKRGRELIRISPKDPNKLEYSTNDGRTWATRFVGQLVGKTVKIFDKDGEIHISTDKGEFSANNGGGIG